MYLFSIRDHFVRRFQILFVVLLVSLGSANVAKASTKEAADFVNDIANRVIEIAKREDLPEEEKEKKLSEIFLKVVDTKWIGRFSLGQYWRNITPEQQNKFLELYSEYLTGMYVPNFRKYTANVVKVTSSKELRPNEYLVQTVIVNLTNSQGNIQINYLLKQDTTQLEKFVIFDVIAEGVSLITTQRAELSSAMANSGFDATMDLLKQKTSSN